MAKKIPPCPKVVPVPAGYRRAKPNEITPTVQRCAVRALQQALPIGKQQAVTVDGKLYVFITEWHYDDHCTKPGNPIWHPGISTLRPIKEPTVDTKRVEQLVASTMVLPKGTQITGEFEACGEDEFGDDDPLAEYEESRMLGEEDEFGEDDFGAVLRGKVKAKVKVKVAPKKPAPKRKPAPVKKPAARRPPSIKKTLPVKKLSAMKFPTIIKKPVAAKKPAPIRKPVPMSRTTSIPKPIPAPKYTSPVKPIPPPNYSPPSPVGPIEPENIDLYTPEESVASPDFTVQESIAETPDYSEQEAALDAYEMPAEETPETADENSDTYDPDAIGFDIAG